MQRVRRRAVDHIWSRRGGFPGSVMVPRISLRPRAGECCGSAKRGGFFGLGRTTDEAGRARCPGARSGGLPGWESVPGTAGLPPLHPRVGPHMRTVRLPLGGVRDGRRTGTRASRVNRWSLGPGRGRGHPKSILPRYRLATPSRSVGSAASSRKRRRPVVAGSTTRPRGTPPGPVPVAVTRRSGLGPGAPVGLPGIPCGAASISGRLVRCDTDLALGGQRDRIGGRSVGPIQRSGVQTRSRG